MSGKATCDAHHINLKETNERKKIEFQRIKFHSIFNAHIKFCVFGDRAKTFNLQ